MLPLLTATLFAASVWLFYPGLVTFDSIVQYREAVAGRFTTTHPPLMAALWRALLPLGPGALPLLVFDLALYWASFLALSLYCIRASGDWRGAFAVLAGLWPLLLSFSGVIWKDVILAAAWGLSAALMLVASQERRGGGRFWTAWTAAGVLLLFGTAMRHNAAPAALVLAFALVGLLPCRFALRAVIFFPLSALLAIAVPISSRAFDATDSAPIENLVSWDLTGISYFSGANYRDPPHMAVPTDWSCYSPRLFDACPLQTFASSGEAVQRWRRAIFAQPLAYLKHRALVFSMLLRFGCRRCRPYIWEEGNPHGPTALGYRRNVFRTLLGYAVKAIGFTPLGRPYLWVALAIGLAAILRKRRAGPDGRVLALTSLSGIVYTLTYFPAAVTDEFRYVYWLIYSVVLVAVAVNWSGRVPLRDTVRWIIVPALLLVIVDTAVQVVSPTDGIAPSMATNY